MSPPPFGRTTSTKGESLAEEVTITVTLRSPGPGRLGRVLDELVPAVREHTGLFEGVQTEIEVPQGWTDIWYGYERDEHAG